MLARKERLLIFKLIKRQQKSYSFFILDFCSRDTNAINTIN